MSNSPEQNQDSNIFNGDVGELELENLGYTEPITDQLFAPTLQQSASLAHHESAQELILTPADQKRETRLRAAIGMAHLPLVACLLPEAIEIDPHVLRRGHSSIYVHTPSRSPILDTRIVAIAPVYNRYVRLEKKKPESLLGLIGAIEGQVTKRDRDILGYDLTLMRGAGVSSKIIEKRIQGFKNYGKAIGKENDRIQRLYERRLRIRKSENIGGEMVVRIDDNINDIPYKIEWFRGKCREQGVFDLLALIPEVYDIVPRTEDFPMVTMIQMLPDASLDFIFGNNLDNLDKYQKESLSQLHLRLGHILKRIHSLRGERFGNIFTIPSVEGEISTPRYESAEAYYTAIRDQYLRQLLPSRKTTTNPNPELDGHPFDTSSPIKARRFKSEIIIMPKIIHYLYNEVLKDAPTKDGKLHIAHGDYVKKNILGVFNKWQELQISGIVDYDHMAVTDEPEAYDGDRMFLSCTTENDREQLMTLWKGYGNDEDRVKTILPRALLQHIRNVLDSIFYQNRNFGSVRVEDLNDDLIGSLHLYFQLLEQLQPLKELDEETQQLKYETSLNFVFVRNKEHPYEEWAKYLGFNVVPLRMPVSEEKEEDAPYESKYSSSVEKEVLGHELIEEVNTALEQLPELQRITFVALHIYGFEPKELLQKLHTAGHEGETLADIELHERKARIFLAKELGYEYGGVYKF